MGERRANRFPPRTDRQILEHAEDVFLLSEIARGRVRVEAANRMTLRRLCREDLCVVGVGFGAVPTLLPRGNRILAAVRGELPAPLED